MNETRNTSKTLLEEDKSNDFVKVALKMADDAGAIAIQHFRNNVPVDYKADESPVTLADRKAETAMRNIIKRQFPDHGILGEEYGSTLLDAKHVWVLDPIDGTVSFAAGFPTFGTLIALLEFGKPIIGIIDLPILGDRWLGTRGHVSTLNGKEVSCRPCGLIENAWISASSPFMFAEGKQRESFERLRNTSLRRPIYSGNCMAYGLLASGFLDIICEASMGPYDYMALTPVVEGAGGLITDWNGDQLSIDSDGTTLATGDPSLHDQVLNLLAD